VSNVTNKLANMDDTWGFEYLQKFMS